MTGTRLRFLPELGTILTAAVAAPAVFAQTAEFAELDQIGGSFVNLPTFPVRPMLIAPDGETLWALNHHDDEVQRYSLYDGSPPVGATHQPIATYPAPWDPVSIAYWGGLDDESEADDEILVVGGGSWGVMGLSVATGEVTRFVQLRPDHALPGGLDARIGRMAEPGDILVDEDTDMAFVSCAGADSVVQIDLTPGLAEPVVRVFHELVAEDDFRCKAPLHLAWDEEPKGEEPRKLLVAPLISGNNSMWGGTLTGGQVVLDLEDPTVADTDLPDEDLFRITPFQADQPGLRGGVEPVARGTGTLLFQHGWNPATGVHWQLNTEAINKDPDLQSEPELNGIFSHDRITRLDDLDGGPSEPDPADIVFLDPDDPNSVKVGQPVGLAFNEDGLAFVTGLLTDNVAILNPFGAPLFAWDVVPSGAPGGNRAIPRAIVYKERLGSREGDVLVYCWGDNTVREYRYDLLGSFSATERAVYDLGHDPTPSQVRAGREIFFDGSNSRFENLSCASCHVENRTDFLIWNLSDNPPIDVDPLNLSKDNKGGMFTQTLVGIDRLPPFHWRGERELDDFNGAFAGLLGGEELDSEELEAFKSYVFSLRNPANPNENRQRLVDDSLSFLHDGQAGTGTEATSGQELFLNEIVFRGRQSCADCHGMPVGTAHDPHDEIIGGGRPKLSHLKPAPFHELWRKQQSSVDVKLVDEDPKLVAYLGAGLAHTGPFVDVHDFVTSITDEIGGPLCMSSSCGENVAAFVHQFDQGLAPAAHYGFYLDDVSHGTAQTELSYLEDQARSVISQVDGQCDVVVMGTAWNGTSHVQSRWWFHRDKGANGLYVADRASLADRTLADFLGGALDDEERWVFLGVPRGMGERFAVDADLDGVRDFDDAMPLTPIFDASDTTGPQFEIAPHVLWESTRVARLVFETTEPSTAKVTYQRNLAGAPVMTVETDAEAPTRYHTVLLTDLHPSTEDPSANPSGWPDAGFPTVSMEYLVEVEVRDLESNPTIYQLSNLTTDPFILVRKATMVPESDVRARHLHMQHVITAIAMDPLVEVEGEIPVTVDFVVSYKRGGDYGSGTFRRKRSANRIVIGRALRKYHDGVTGYDRHVKLDSTVDTAVTLSVDEVDLVPDPARDLSIGGLEDSGKFLVSRVRTDANGATSIEFAVDAADVASGDSIVFVVDAVVEIADDAAWASIGSPTTVLSLPTELGPPWDEPVDGEFAFNQWSFPDTKEANAFVERVVP